MSEGFKVQASIKDNDGDMVNFRADSVAELEAEFGGFPYGAYAQAKANLRGAGALAQITQSDPQQAPPVQQEQPAPQAAWGTINPAQGGFVPAQQGQQWQGGQQAPPQQPAGPEFHPEGIQCQTCGGRVQKKNLTRKSDGKAFSLWTCPNQRSKGDGHFSEFAN